MSGAGTSTGGRLRRPKRAIVVLIAALVGLSGLGATAGVALGEIGAASSPHVEFGGHHHRPVPPRGPGTGP